MNESAPEINLTGSNYQKRIIQAIMQGENIDNVDAVGEKYSMGINPEYCINELAQLKKLGIIKKESPYPGAGFVLSDNIPQNIKDKLSIK
jgi:ABC-type phosphate/phosphonate transport system substrate-binding protein